MDDRSVAPTKLDTVEDVRRWLSSLNGQENFWDVLKNRVTKDNVRYLSSGLSDDDFFHMLPAGLRFRPTDIELVSEYLAKKINGQDLPRSRIHVVNMMSFDPERLAEAHEPSEKNVWYFFTPRYKKYRGGRRPNRAAGGGFWKATGADKSIKHNNVVIGYRKALVYYKGTPRHSTKTDWIMHEYKVHNSRVMNPSSLDVMRLDDWVLCNIHKKAPKQPRQGPENTQEGNTDMNDTTMEYEVETTPETDTTHALVEADDAVPLNSQPLNTGEGPFGSELSPLLQPLPFNHDNQIGIPQDPSLPWNDHPLEDVFSFNMMFNWDSNSYVFDQPDQIGTSTNNSSIGLSQLPPDQPTFFQATNASVQQNNCNPLREHYSGDTATRALRTPFQSVKVDPNNHQPSYTQDSSSGNI